MTTEETENQNPLAKILEEPFFKEHPKVVDFIRGGTVVFALGLFHIACSKLDVTTDFAICKFLKVTAGESHLITAGMMFGRKARLLADLIGRSDHPRKAALLGAFNAVRGSNKREILIHGHIYSQSEADKTVSFIERSVSGEFKATIHTFTVIELLVYASHFSQKVNAFSTELGASEDEIRDFSKAALSLNRKSKTSPGNPTDSNESLSPHQS